MNIQEIESAGLKRKYQVTVPAHDIQEEMETELKNAGKHVKIPGFRPGFVPMKILQQRYGKAVEGDVLKNVIQRATGQVITDKKLRPALTPQVNVEAYEQGKELTFSMSMELFPEVGEVAFEKITLNRRTFEVSEPEIDDACTKISERSPSFAPAEDGAKAELGNVVEIDFKGSIDGVEFEGGTAENFRLELGSKQFIDTFEAQLEGAKAGESREVKVTFPEHYHSANLAGKPAVFAVSVKQVLVKTPAVIDEEFAKARGFADLRALREVVRNQIIREYDGLVRTQLKKELFDVLEEKLQIDLPQTMVEMEFNNIWERIKQAQEQGDETLAGKDEATLREEYMAIAQRRVKLGLFLAEVSNKHRLQVTREELGRAAMQQAGMFPGQERAVMDFYKKNPERLEDLRGPILEEKAVDFILTKVAYKDMPVSVEELLKSAEEEDGAEAKPAAKSGAKSSKPKKAKKDAE